MSVQQVEQVLPADGERAEAVRFVPHKSRLSSFKFVLYDDILLSILLYSFHITPLPVVAHIFVTSCIVGGNHWEVESYFGPVTLLQSFVPPIRPSSHATPDAQGLLDTQITIGRQI